MAGFDFATTTEAQSETTEAVETDDSVNPDWDSNEVGDLYLSGVDYEMVTFAIMKAEEYEKLKRSGDDTIGDAPRLLEQHSEAHPMQKLHLVASLFKSTCGKFQTGGIEGVEANVHSIGLQDSKAPTEHPENRPSYALFSKDLPTIEWDDLDGGEREVLEEDYDIDVDRLGFDTTYGGPKLPVVNGRRVPIVPTEGGEIQEALEILSELPDIPSGYTEDGFRESSDPSVFDSSEESTDKVGSDDTEADSEVNLAANPEAISGVNVTDIRKNVTDITNIRSIKTMLRVEREGKNRSSAIQRLEERRNAIEGAEGNDDEETEEAEETDADDDQDSLSEAEMELVNTLISTDRAETVEEAKAQVRSL